MYKLQFVFDFKYSTDSVYNLAQQQQFLINAEKWMTQKGPKVALKELHLYFMSATYPPIERVGGSHQFIKYPSTQLSLGSTRSPSWHPYN